MGWLWSAPAGLEPAPPLYAMRRFIPLSYVHNKPRLRLIRCTRGEFTQRFRLSQAYVYIIPRFSAPKLAKFQNKKVGRSHDQLSNLRSQLLVAHDTYKTILTR